LFVRLGVAAWSFVGLVVTGAIIVSGLATVSSVVLPLVFAAVLAVLFRPVAAGLERHRFTPSLAAATVLAGLAAAIGAILFVTERGIVSQGSLIVDRIVDGLDQLEISPDTIAKVEAALGQLQPGISTGFVKSLVAGLSSLSGFMVAVVLGALIMYYLLKDGPKLRRSLVARTSTEVAGELDGLISETCYVLRRYWLGRTAVAAVVAVVVGAGALVLGLPLVLSIVVVTFVGGYVPYFGAVVAGALAVVVAMGSGGLGAAVVMLVIVLVANLGVENLVEPAITG
jgi:predicted PurR-regulated permease PerM